MAVRGHRYRVTVEHIATPRGDEPLHAPLVFEAVNHDEILGIADRARAKSGFASDQAAALAIGLKLFGEVMLLNRDDPLFAELRGPWREFIGKLKARHRGEEQSAA